MSQATTSGLLLSDTNLINTGTAYAFNECTLAGARTNSIHMGHRGRRERSSCRARTTTDKCSGSISGNFSVSELDYLLRKVFSKTTTSGYWAPDDTVPFFYAFVNKVAGAYRYNKLRIRSFEVSGQETQYLNWNFATVGETEDSAVWPLVPPDATCGTAYLFSDCTLTYGAATFPLQSFRLSIDNAIDENQYENSLTPTRFEAQDFIVQLQATCAFRSDTIALYDAALAGQIATLAVSDGVVRYAFRFANLKYMSGAPTVPARGRINMPLSFEAFTTERSTFTEDDHSCRIEKTVL